MEIIILTTFFHGVKQIRLEGKFTNQFTIYIIMIYLYIFKYSAILRYKQNIFI